MLGMKAELTMTCKESSILNKEKNNCLSLTVLVQYMVGIHVHIVGGSRHHLRCHQHLSQNQAPKKRGFCMKFQQFRLSRQAPAAHKSEPCGHLRNKLCRALTLL